MKNTISFETAKAYIERFRSNRDNIEVPEFKGSLSFSETFEVEAFKALVDQPGCVGVRIYYGMKDDLKICAVIVGVNAENQDVVGDYRTGERDIIIEDSELCPPVCAPISAF
jgi:hypothetical protein